MGQLGFQELFVIFLIALLVFGPRKLPELGKSLGKGLREFKRATEDLKSSWEDHMKDVEEPFKEATKDIHRECEPRQCEPRRYAQLHARIFARIHATC